MKEFVISNAVWYKDLVTDAKRAKLVSITLSVNAIMTFVACVALVILQICGTTFTTIPQRFLLGYFIVFVSIQSSIIFFLVPAITAGCISVEKERQTLDVLLTTRMTPWQIVKGKYASAVSIVIILIITSLPMLSLVQIYGGISFLRMLFVMLTLIVAAMYIASFGVFFSSLFKNTVISVIVTYLFVGVLLLGTFFFATIVWAITAGVSSQLYYENRIPDEYMLAFDWIMMILYINPAVTLFDVMGQAFGFDLFGEETLKGMATVMTDLGGWSEQNILTLLWTPFSMICQLTITYGVLRAAGVFLNPLRGRKHKNSKRKEINVPGNAN